MSSTISLPRNEFLGAAVSPCVVAGEAVYLTIIEASAIDDLNMEELHRLKFERAGRFLVTHRLLTVDDWHDVVEKASLSFREASLGASRGISFDRSIPLSVAFELHKLHTSQDLALQEFHKIEGVEAKEVEDVARTLLNDEMSLAEAPYAAYAYVSLLKQGEMHPGEKESVVFVKQLESVLDESTVQRLLSMESADRGNLLGRQGERVLALVDGSYSVLTLYSDMFEKDESALVYTALQPLGYKREAPYFSLDVSNIFQTPAQLTENSEKPKHTIETDSLLDSLDRPHFLLDPDSKIDLTDGLSALLVSANLKSTDIVMPFVGGHREPVGFERVGITTDKEKVYPGKADDQYFIVGDSSIETEALSDDEKSALLQLTAVQNHLQGIYKRLGMDAFNVGGVEVALLPVSDTDSQGQRFTIASKMGDVFLLPDPSNEKGALHSLSDTLADQVAIHASESTPLSDEGENGKAQRILDTLRERVEIPFRLTDWGKNQESFQGVKRELLLGGIAVAAANRGRFRAEVISSAAVKNQYKGNRALAKQVLVEKLLKNKGMRQSRRDIVTLDGLEIVAPEAYESVQSRFEYLEEKKGDGKTVQDHGAIRGLPRKSIVKMTEPALIEYLDQLPEHLAPAEITLTKIWPSTKIEDIKTTGCTAEQGVLILGCRKSLATSLPAGSSREDYVKFIRLIMSLKAAQVDTVSGAGILREALENADLRSSGKARSFLRLAATLSQEGEEEGWSRLLSMHQTKQRRSPVRKQSLYSLITNTEIKRETDKEKAYELAPIDGDEAVFVESLNISGVEFGNYSSQAERKKYVNLVL